MKTYPYLCTVNQLIIRIMTNLEIAKNILEIVALEAKSIERGDNPKIRQIINDTADSIAKDMKLNNADVDRLSNYACKLHPKK